MTFHDCLFDATRAAIEDDVPAWLLPAVIANQATLLAGGDQDSDDFTNCR